MELLRVLRGHYEEQWPIKRMVSYPWHSKSKGMAIEKRQVTCLTSPCVLSPVPEKSCANIWLSKELM